MLVEGEDGCGVPPTGFREDDSASAPTLWEGKGWAGGVVLAF